MNDLRHRAHTALNEYRQGRGSPSGELSPTGDNDELSILGGKGRLVKREPGTPPPNFLGSPSQLNGVIPFPVSPSIMHDGNSYVAEYLGSFQHQHQSNGHGYSNVDISTVPMQSMASTVSSSFSLPHTEQQSPSGYYSSTQTSPLSAISHHQQDQSMSMMNGHPHQQQTHQQQIPQYFPVYDYGSAMNTSYQNGGSQLQQGLTMLDTRHSDVPGPQRRTSSDSPESNNMDTTWVNFVQQSI